jgi:hypothetical protein
MHLLSLWAFMACYTVNFIVLPLLSHFEPVNKLSCPQELFPNCQNLQPTCKQLLALGPSARARDARYSRVFDGYLCVQMKATGRKFRINGVTKRRCPCASGAARRGAARLLGRSSTCCHTVNCCALRSHSALTDRDGVCPLCGRN